MLACVDEGQVRRAFANGS